MSDAPQSSLAPPTCVTSLTALETNETTQAKPDDIQYSSETASPLCNETAVDHPVHTHANEGGDHSASEQTISECAVSEAKLLIWTVTLTVGHCLLLEPTVILP